jgi:crossover junction endodeoxyribonuclease RusA
MTTSTDAITITLPLPRKELNEHNKGHWRAKTKAVRELRELAHVEAIAAGAPRMYHGRIYYRFYWPDNRRRDEANAIQMLKPAVDGIVDAGVVHDDSWQYLGVGGVTSEIDRENPRVEITIEQEPQHERD